MDGFENVGDFIGGRVVFGDVEYGGVFERGGVFLVFFLEFFGVSVCWEGDGVVVISGIIMVFWVEERRIMVRWDDEVVVELGRVIFVSEFFERE